MTPSAPLVLMPLGPGEFIALEPAELAAARDRAREVLGPGWGADRGAGGTTQTPKKLLTAAEMEALTAVKSAWFLEAARAGTVPHHRIGRYVRFDLAEIRDCTRYRSSEAQGAGGKAS